MKSSESNRALDFLYGTAPGRLLLKPLVQPCVSRFVGRFADSELSVPLIKPFTALSGINTDDFEARRYTSFNDFFTRQLRPTARKLCSEPDAIISPCDCRMSVYPITSASAFRIKHSIYDAASLTGSKRTTERYSGGYCVICRLCVADYHRYHFIDNGRIFAFRHIDGILHTVMPIAQQHFPIYLQNTREITVMKTERLGLLTQIEVGAMLVGKIHNNKTQGSFTQNEEKGCFMYGGSTIVLLFEKGSAAFDDELMFRTERGFESRVLYGQRIGTII